MTEREFFNAGLQCGDMPEARELGRFSPGCGARDWRPYRSALLPPWSRKLICSRCGARLLVEMPGWRDRQLHPVTPEEIFGSSNIQVAQYIARILADPPTGQAGTEDGDE